MPRSISIPSQQYSVSQYQFTIDRLPNNSEGFILSFTRENWPTGNCLQILVERADAAGVYEHWREATFPGGTITRRDGTVETVSSLRGEWPTVRGAKQRKTNIRVTVNVLQQLRTAVTLDYLR